MISIEEIINEFEEIENGCEYGSLAVVVCEDGSYWYCNRDFEALSKQIEFRKAPVNMQDALAESLLEPEALFLSQEDKSEEDRKFDEEQPSRVRVESFNQDYYGTKDEIINEVMAGAFEPPFGSDFSL